MKRAGKKVLKDEQGAFLSLNNETQFDGSVPAYV
jgi:hypothetical protein